MPGRPERRFAVGDAAEVLHRARREVRDSDHVELLAGIGDVEVLGEEAQREGARFKRDLREMAFADRVHDAQRHAIDVEGGRLFEGSDDKGDEIGGHHHGGSVAHRALTVAEVGVRIDGGVRIRRELARDREIDLERGLEVRFVEAGKGAPGVGVLKLRRGDGVLDPGIVGVGRTIKAVELIVQGAVKGDLDDGGAGRNLAVEDERGGLVRVVEAVLERAITRAVAAQRRGAELKVERVHRQFAQRLYDLHVDFDAPSEGKSLEIRREKDAISGRDDRSSETIGVGRWAHSWLHYDEISYDR